MPADLVTLLGRTSPFTGLAKATRERIVTASDLRTVPAGESVLVEGGAPGVTMYLVVDGAFELVRGGRVVDVITPGQLFGHPTLLTGYPPEFTVRAREDSALLAIPGEEALDVLSRPEGIAFVAATLRDRVARALSILREDRDARHVSVLSLARRPALFCTADTTVAEAARRMGSEGSGAMLVRLPDGLGIVTNADLRDKVVVAGVAADAPVSAIMTVPVLTVRADALAQEASIEMLEAGVQHMPVTDQGGRVLGVVSSADLMTLDEMSPFAVRRALSRARNAEELIATAGRLPEIFLSLLDAHLEPTAITRVLTLQTDVVTTRLLELVQERLGPAPLPYAWLALGSMARGELTMVSDQDNALAYVDPDDPVAAAYFASLASETNAGLARCGFALDYSGVNAQNDVWRLSESQWHKAFADCFAAPDHSHLIRASIVFDLRHVHGDLPVAEQLAALMQDASRRTGFVAAMARTVIEVPSPLGFLRRLRGPIDIKRTGLLPLANIARFHALANGVKAVSTLDRLTTLERMGALDPPLAESLQRAFVRTTAIRLEHHAEALRAGRRPDDAIDTALLDPLSHAELQQALRLIDSAQQLTQSFPLGLRQ
jgi:CBS domain-containing protein